MKNLCGLWDKDLIVENDGELGRISDNTRPGNANIGDSKYEKNKRKNNDSYACAPSPLQLSWALGMLTKYAEVEAAAESKKTKAAAARIVKDGWLKKGIIWYWAGKNELNSKFNAFPRTFHGVIPTKLIRYHRPLDLPEKLGPTSISIISRGTAGFWLMGNLSTTH